MNLEFSDCTSERIRLVLSTYQDGSGMLASSPNSSLPGWRDFERTTAFVFDGEAQEDKSIFDVIVGPFQNGLYSGISCKMRRELKSVNNKNQVSMEISNSAGKFWDGIIQRTGLSHSTYKKNPKLVGNTLLNLVEEWHNAESTKNGGNIDLKNSYYFVLEWDNSGEYQLFVFPIGFPERKRASWDFPSSRCLRGIVNNKIIFEWYGESGGQLKYYPMVKRAIYKSSIFKLEQIRDKGIYLENKVSQYFKNEWEATFR